jgi:hypothetical protein
MVAVSTPRERPNVEAGAVIGIVLPAEHCVVLRR